MAPAVEVPASLTPLSLVYVLCPARCPARAACLSRQLSVIAEELPSAHQAHDYHSEFIFWNLICTWKHLQQVKEWVCGQTYVAALIEGC